MPLQVLIDNSGSMSGEDRDSESVRLKCKDVVVGS